MKNFVYLLISFTLISCASDNEDQVVTINDTYSLTIPSFLKQVDNLNEEASLQYQNGIKEFYVMVIDESKAELQQALEDNDLQDLYQNNLDSYSELLINSMVASLRDSKHTTVIKDTIGGMPARITSIKGEIDDVKIFYSLAFCEGESRYYQVYTWTLLERASRHKSKMKEILYSLREVEK